jgi:tetratricopeptide (TPR) repeat protein
MPDKSLNEIPRDIRDLYQRGKDALQRQNFDYAITFFNQALQREPGFLECRQHLRVAQSKKVGGSTGFFKKMVGGASVQPLIAKAQFAKGKNPLEAIQIAEQILETDPSNSSAHRILAECAMAADLPKTACFSYEILLKNSSRDFDLGMAYAEALTKSGQIDKAENYYGELQRAFPQKGEIFTAVKNLSARRTLNEGGYDALASGTGSYRDILKDKSGSEKLEQENRVIRSDDRTNELLAEYEARSAREPDNLKLLRNIAELHAQKKDFDKALDFYQRIRATEAGGADSSLEKAIAETSLKRLDHLISQLDLSIPEQAAQADQLRAEKIVYQLEETKKRAERYPTDLQIKFELGQLYFGAGRYNEAMSEFQKAQANPQRRLLAMFRFGQCLSAKGMADMAARKFQEVLKEKVGFDDEKKEMIYELGVVLDKMGKKEEAIEQLKLIYEVDMGYKDVAKRVDDFYSGQG